MRRAPAWRLWLVLVAGVVLPTPARAAGVACDLAPEECARLLLARGVGERSAGRLAEAAETFRQAVVADPVGVPARLELAVTESWRGRLVPADSAYREALRLDPGNLAARLGLARVATWRHDWAAAEAAYLDLLVVPAARVAALAGLAAVREARLDFRGARQYVSEALRLAPNDPDAQALGHRLHGAGRVEVQGGVTGGSGAGPGAEAAIRVLASPDLTLHANWVRRARELETGIVTSPVSPAGGGQLVTVGAGIKLSERVQTGFAYRFELGPVGTTHSVTAEGGVRVSARSTLSGGIRPGFGAAGARQVLGWLGLGRQVAPKQDLALQLFHATATTQPPATAVAVRWSASTLAPVKLRVSAARGWNGAGAFDDLLAEVELSLGARSMLLSASRHIGAERWSQVRVGGAWRW